MSKVIMRSRSSLKKEAHICATSGKFVKVYSQKLLVHLTLVQDLDKTCTGMTWGLGGVVKVVSIFHPLGPKFSLKVPIKYCGHFWQHDLPTKN